MIDDDVATAALLKFLNAAETGIAAAKRTIEAAKIEWNPNAIRWRQVEGSSGPYERTEDADNSHFKGMLKELKAHNGKMTKNEHFYWIFPQGTTVGRKKRAQQVRTGKQQC